MNYEYQELTFPARCRQTNSNSDIAKRPATDVTSAALDSTERPKFAHSFCSISRAESPCPSGVSAMLIVFDSRLATDYIMY